MAKNNILTVEKTMGGLREINLGTEPAYCLRSNNAFQSEVETIRIWSHYGQYNENRLHLQLEGSQPESIKVGNVEFWPVVKDVNYFQLSSSIQHHTFTLNGRLANGQVFEEEFFIDGGEVLPAVVYAICLISEIGSPALAAEYWSACHKNNGHLNYATKGEFLDKVVKFKEHSEKLMKEYPFMQGFLQRCLKKLVDDLKDSLDYISFLK